MDKTEEIAGILRAHGKTEVFSNELLAGHTSFKIGGPAALFAEPEDTDALCFVLNYICKEGIRHFILGGGTNIVFSDSGFDGIIISTKRLSGLECIPAPSGENVAIRAGAGTKMSAIVNFACDKSLTGLEEFAGLPGTCGGAAFMNARCFDKEISNVAGKISWIEYDGTSKEYIKKEKAFAAGDWAYKKSPFTEGGKIITQVEFNLTKAGDPAAIQERARNFVLSRKARGHFDYPCAGSVFKNNRSFGEPTGKIIDSLGLKGRRIGGAQIAPFHGNIIINTGNAKCEDVLALVDTCKKEALEKYGFSLEEEIIFVE